MDKIIEMIPTIAGGAFFLFLLFLLFIYPKITSKKKEENHGVIHTVIFQADSNNSGTHADEVFKELEDRKIDPNFLGDE